MATHYTYNPATQKWEATTTNDPADTGGSGGSSSGGGNSGSSGSGSQPNTSAQAKKEYKEIELKTLEGDLSVKPSTKSIQIAVNTTIQLDGFGKYLSGKYFVSSIKRSLNSSGGYSETISVLKNGFGDGVKNPDESNRPAEIQAVVPVVYLGDKVKIVGDAIYAYAYDGVPVPVWVKTGTYTVQEFSDDNTRVRLKELNKWVYSSNIRKV